MNALARLGEMTYEEFINDLADRCAARVAPPDPKDADGVALLSLKRVMEITGMRRDAIADRVNRGVFPPPVRGGGRVGGGKQLWRSDEIQDFINS